MYGIFNEKKFKFAYMENALILISLSQNPIEILLIKRNKNEFGHHVVGIQQAIGTLNFKRKTRSSMLRLSVLVR